MDQTLTSQADEGYACICDPHQQTDICQCGGTPLRSHKFNKDSPVYRTVGAPSCQPVMDTQISLWSPLDMTRQPSGPHVQSLNPSLIQPTVSTQGAEQDDESAQIGAKEHRLGKIKRAFSLIDKEGYGTISKDQLVTFLCGKDKHSDSSTREKSKQYLNYLEPLFKDRHHEKKRWGLKDFEQFMLSKFEGAN